jgi:hypothetical protein
MPLKPHPTDPDKMVYYSRQYDLPQRTWVGLTDKELEEFSDAELGSYDLCLEVEAKLKERNT